MDKFLEMATRYNYLTQGAKRVYDISDQPIDYDYNNWDTNEQNALADVCANSNTELLNNQAYGQELFSSPNGQESVSEALGVGKVVRIRMVLHRIAGFRMLLMKSVKVQAVPLFQYKLECL